MAATLKSGVGLWLCRESLIGVSTGLDVILVMGPGDSDSGDCESDTEQCGKPLVWKSSPGKMQ